MQSRLKSKTKTTKEYFPQKYLHDQKIYSEKVGDCLCRRGLNKLFQNVRYSDFIDIEYYLLCQYEINLISQVIYTHFKDDFEQWKSCVPEYTDCRCTYSKHPINILEFTEFESKSTDHPIIFSANTILEWDQYFKEYIDEMCRNNKFNTLSSEKLFDAIKNDPDCENEKVRNYFSRKIRALR